MDVREWMRKPRDATGAGATCVLSRASVRRGYGGIYTARRYVYIPSPTRCGCTRTTSRRDVMPSERSPSTTIIANTQNTSQTIHRTNIAIGIGINQSIRARRAIDGARNRIRIYHTHHHRIRPPSPSPSPIHPSIVVVVHTRASFRKSHPSIVRGFCFSDDDDQTTTRRWRRPIVVVCANSATPRRRRRPGKDLSHSGAKSLRCGDRPTDRATVERVAPVRARR